MKIRGGIRVLRSHQSYALRLRFCLLFRFEDEECSHFVRAPEFPLGRCQSLLKCQSLRLGFERILFALSISWRGIVRIVSKTSSHDSGDDPTGTFSGSRVR